MTLIDFLSGVKHAFFFAGCPDNSIYSGKRECVCNEGLVYSTQTFQCVPIYIDMDSNRVSILNIL